MTCNPTSQPASQPAVVRSQPNKNHTHFYYLGLGLINQPERCGAAAVAPLMRSGCVIGDALVCCIYSGAAMGAVWRAFNGQL